MLEAGAQTHCDQSRDQSSSYPHSTPLATIKLSKSNKMFKKWSIFQHIWKDVCTVGVAKQYRSYTASWNHFSVFEKLPEILDNIFGRMKFLQLVSQNNAEVTWRHGNISRYIFEKLPEILVNAIEKNWKAVGECKRHWFTDSGVLETGFCTTKQFKLEKFRRLEKFENFKKCSEIHNVQKNHEN